MELLIDFGMPKLYSLDLGSTNVTAEGVRWEFDYLDSAQPTQITEYILLTDGNNSGFPVHFYR